MTTEATATKNGIFTSRYGTDPKRAMYHIECIKHIGSCTESFPVDEVWKFFDDLTIEKREELIKRAAKSDKKKAAKFTTKAIPKPENVINRYRKEYREECKTSGKEFKETEFKEAYHAISEETKARLQAEHEADKKRFDEQYEAARQQAILNGDYTEPRPKAPQTSYFLFSNMVQEDIKLGKKGKYLTADQRKEFEELMKVKPYTGPVAKKISVLYAELSDKDRKVWTDKAEAAKVEHNKEVYEWSVRVLQRKIAKCEREDTDPTPYRKELEEVMTAGPAKLKPKVVVATTDTAATAKTKAKATKPTVKVTVTAKAEAETPDAATTEGTEGTEGDAATPVVATAEKKKRGPAKKTTEAAPAAATETETSEAEAEPAVVAAPAEKKKRGPAKKAPPPEPVVEEEEEETA